LSAVRYRYKRPPKRRKPVVLEVPAVVKATDPIKGAKRADVDDAILDGEVIAADETGRPQFYDLLRDTRASAYVAFDVIWLNGADLRLLPLSKRRRHLQNILPKRSATISGPLSVTGMGHKLFELMCAHDLEGVVAKRLKHGYGPSVRWLKIKNPSYSQNEGRRELFDRSAGAQRRAADQ
jgi:ATP-dependent DNA ligase